MEAAVKSYRDAVLSRTDSLPGVNENTELSCEEGRVVLSEIDLGDTPKRLDSRVRQGSQAAEEMSAPSSFTATQEPIDIQSIGTPDSTPTGAVEVVFTASSGMAENLAHAEIAIDGRAPSSKPADEKGDLEILFPKQPRVALPAADTHPHQNLIRYLNLEWNRIGEKWSQILMREESLRRWELRLQAFDRHLTNRERQVTSTSRRNNNRRNRRQPHKKILSREGLGGTEDPGTTAG